MTRAVNTKKIIWIVIVVICLLFLLWNATPAHAQVANVAMAELYVTIMDACAGWLQKAGAIALQLLAVTAVIGFAIGGKDLALAGHVTLDGIVALLVRYAFIVGLLTWLLSAPQRLALITASIKKIGSTISGQDIGFGSLMALFSEVTNPLVEFTSGLGWTDVGLIICMTFVIFLINCLFFMIASTVLVVEIEAIFILTGGLFTAPFFAIGYFRDMFLGYVKALAAVGVKMLMLCLCLGAMRNIMSKWPGMIAIQLQNAESVFSFLMPMSCALIGFYMLVKAVPQFASSVMTGSVSGMEGGMVRAAAAAGYGLGATVVSVSRTAAQKVMGGASVVSQAAQTYQYTSQAARDTGSSPSGARSAGAAEALKTVAAGTQSGGPRAAGERSYSDYQRGQQFADVRSSGVGRDTLGVPPTPRSTQKADAAMATAAAINVSSGVPQNPTLDSVVQGIEPYRMPSSTSAFGPAVHQNLAAAGGSVSIAGSAEAKAASVKTANDAYGSASTSEVSWGSFASDRKQKEGGKK
jgi:type IV secretory pathway TrbL component